MIVYAKTQSLGDDGIAPLIATELGIPEISAHLLCKRGYDSIAKAKEFLDPNISMLHDPYMFEQMQDAVDCIYAAIAMEEKICIYGDYDVDGIMAVTILTRYLKSIGAQVLSYIPSRHSEGYGLNIQAIERLCEQGVSLIITADCGISAVAEIEYAYSLGLSMIITDHHQCPELLPECEAIVNPAKIDAYPYKKLCGAGVALKLAQAMMGEEGSLKPYLPFAAIATIADIVELTGENRVIVAEGLRLINAGKCSVGIRSLSDAAGYIGRPITTSAIGFGIAPRINAAGRTGCAEDALELFLTDDAKRAKKLAQKLNEENINRQNIEQEIMNEALNIIENQIDTVEDCAIILCKEGWNQGVIGIVASKLVERFNKPILLFGCENGICTGSGRSIRGVHLFESLSAFKDLFIRYGGHEMAAGVSLNIEKMNEFSQLFLQYLKRNTPVETFVPKAYYDIEIEEGQISLNLAESIQCLAPFGIGNQEPTFRVSSIVSNARTMGKDKSHLKFTIGTVECAAFNKGNMLLEIAQQKADILTTIDINNFQSRPKVQCIVRKIKPLPPEDPKAQSYLNLHKFKDAFYQSMNYMQREESAKVSLCELEGLNQMLQEPQGTLVLCFTPQGAVQLIECINKGQISEIDLIYEKANDLCAYNTAILAPILDEFPIKRYKRIVVFDDCLNQNSLSYLRSFSAKVYLMNRDCFAFVNTVAYDRDKLIPVYRAMCELAKISTSFLDKEEYCNLLCSSAEIERSAALFAIRVFDELGFINVDTKGHFRVNAESNPKKNALTDSKYFNFAQEAKNEFYRYRSSLGGIL